MLIFQINRCLLQGRQSEGKIFDIERIAMNNVLQTTENTQEAATEALEIDPLKMQAF